MHYEPEEVIKDDEGKVIARSCAEVTLHTDEFGVWLFFAACVGAGIYHFFLS